MDERDSLHRVAVVGRRPLTRRRMARLAGASAATFAVWTCLPRARATTDVEQALGALTAGRPLGDAARVRLELPDHFDYGNTVPLAFEVESPMTEADHVRRVDVLADGNPFPEVATFHFTLRSGRARAATRIRLNEGRREVTAVATLSDGSACVARRSLEVAIGGCSAEAGVAVPYPMPTPEPRLEVPAEAGRDQIVEIRTMISHWMETGLRTDLQGKPIARRIINRMACRSPAGLIFAADLSPAIAANAYLSFAMVAHSSSMLEFTWREDGGTVYRATRPLLAV